MKWRIKASLAVELLYCWGISKCLLPISVGKTTQMNSGSYNWIVGVTTSNSHRLSMQNVLVLHLIQWYPMWVCFWSLSLRAKGQTKYQIWTVYEWHTQKQMCEKEANIICCSLYLFWKEVCNSDFHSLAGKVMENVAIYCCNVSASNQSQPQSCYEKWRETHRVYRQLPLPVKGSNSTSGVLSDFLSILCLMLLLWCLTVH